jgi:hypothetical protein
MKMTSSELDNLVSTGKLKRQAFSQVEFDSLVQAGEARLRDAANGLLSLESRFDLAYNASHSFALAALRWHGYRSDQRYLVFQTVEHTLGLAPSVWRILDKSHRVRNLADYEGQMQITQRLLEDLLRAAESVHMALRGLSSSCRSTDQP